MTSTLLLDTHILIRWIADPRRLSAEQTRVLTSAEQRGEPFGISAMSLIELAHLFRAGPARLRLDQEHVYQVLETATLYHIFPITIPIAREFGAILTPLQDPADAIIAATARVHGLRLLTSDQRIIKANVVSTIE